MVKDIAGCIKSRNKIKEQISKSSSSSLHHNHHIYTYTYIHPPTHTYTQHCRPPHTVLYNPPTCMLPRLNYLTFRRFFLPHTKLKLHHLSSPPSQQATHLLHQHRTYTNSPSFPSSLKARLIITHSTYIPGLLDVLHRLITLKGLHPPYLNTIVPGKQAPTSTHARRHYMLSYILTHTHTGRLATTRGKAAAFRIKISAPTPQGHKALVRKGQSVQEVFFTGEIEGGALQTALEEATRKEGVK